MEVQLVQLGRYGDQKYQLTDRECVIGREPSCDLRPDHGRVSKRHTRLFWKGSRLFAEDLNSADGTRINGEPIDAATEVRDGDELSVGPVTYMVMIAADAAELAARGDQWVDSAVRKHHPDRAVGVGPSDSNVIISPAMQTARKILDRIHGDEEEEKPLRGAARAAGAGGRRAERRRAGEDPRSDPGRRDGHPPALAPARRADRRRQAPDRAALRQRRAVLEPGPEQRARGLRALPRRPAVR